ncbi:hypothetical protein RhiTH_003688 [Rhizoctonia solani]|uniref:Uncharacterized protein n=1 Tax=Rhizoctonia solani TaxID=456999 RepID=A0A8H7H0Z5_9AGAM|nr:hypothetical protein RHS04_07880 [Rhizoctonia solani]KAF8749491.1 hypothetical protein RHS01_10007 [Rhizoctonia solani]KAF8749494.1 hypothetical protein RHS01_10008 [Rhizoctonia solani]
MYAIAKFFVVLASALSFASSAVAAPVEASVSSDLAARAPYDVHNGWATYYNPSAGIGSCGWQNRDDEWVAAVGTSLFQEMMIGEWTIHAPQPEPVAFPVDHALTDDSGRSQTATRTTARRAARQRA